LKTAEGGLRALLVGLGYPRRVTVRVRVRIVSLTRTMQCVTIGQFICTAKADRTAAVSLT